MTEKDLKSICNNIIMFLMLFALGFYILSIIEKGSMKNYTFVLGILSTGIFAFLIIIISGSIKTDRASIIAIFGISMAMLMVWNHFIKAVR